MSAPTRAGCLAAVLAALVGCGSTRSDADVEPQHLHVIVDRLPQCDYGVGFERPLRIELLYEGEVVARARHGGTYMGTESIQVPLHVPNALPGRYRIRFGQCPSLVDDPAGAVACESPDWQRGRAVRLRPAGIENPQVVEYYRVRARCLQPNR